MDLYIPPKPAIIIPGDIKVAWDKSWLATFPFPFHHRAQTVKTAYSALTDVDSTTNENYTFRLEATSLAFGGRQVRLVLEAPASAGSCQVDNFSIGVSTTNGDTAATPVELKVGGSSGYLQAAGSADITTDWADLVLTAGGKALCIFDVASSNGNVRTKTTAGDQEWNKTATNSYNVATVSGGGYTNAANRTRFFKRIEVRE